MDTESNNILRRQVEEQRQTINALLRVVNYHTQYMTEYRTAHNLMFKRRLYWMMNWIRPLTLPLYRKPKCIPLLARPDDIPVLLPGPLYNEIAVEFDDVNIADVFTDEFLVGKSEED